MESRSLASRQEALSGILAALDKHDIEIEQRDGTVCIRAGGHCEPIGHGQRGRLEATSTVSWRWSIFESRPEADTSASARPLRRLGSKPFSLPKFPGIGWKRAE